MMVSNERFQGLKRKSRDSMAKLVASREIEEADKLARLILGVARDLLLTQKVGAFIMVDVPKRRLTFTIGAEAPLRHHEVSTDNLMFSLMILSPEYGFRTESSIEGRFHFTKVGAPDEPKPDVSDPEGAHMFPLRLSPAH